MDLQTPGLMIFMLMAGVQALSTGRAMVDGAREMIAKKPQGQISAGIMRAASTPWPCRK